MILSYYQKFRAFVLLITWFISKLSEAVLSGEAHSVGNRPFTPKTPTLPLAITAQAAAKATLRTGGLRGIRRIVTLT